MTLLTDWLAHPSGSTIGELVGNDTWRCIPYSEFADEVAARSVWLADQLPVGQPVVLAASAGLDMLATWFAAVTVGCPPVIVPPPGLESRATYLDSGADLVAHLGAGMVVTDGERLRSELATVIERGPASPLVATIADVTAAATSGGRCDPAVRPSEVAFLQRTSGTSGVPRVLEVTHAGLDANLVSARRRNQIEPDDGIINWLPLHHDLGLVGTVLLGMCSGAHVRLMSATQLIRSPLSWLGPLGRGEATLTSSATFALDLVLRRLPEELPESFDFSTWRVLCLGGERVDLAAMAPFAARLAPRGFDVTTFSPGYGLAETTLGVSCTHSGRPAVAISESDRRRWSEGGPAPVVRPVDDDLLASAASEPWIVASGMPLGGVDVNVIPIDGATDPVIGEIVVRTPSTCRRFGSDHDAPVEVSTGDAGFLLDGHLFVLGRIGDAVKVNGRLVHAEEVEADLRRAAGLADLRACVLLGTSSSGDQQLILVVESSTLPGWMGSSVDVLTKAVSGKVPCGYVLAGRGAIPRTSSGKPRRRQAWVAAANGELGEIRPIEAIETVGALS